jgi:hypothetical protein
VVKRPDNDHPGDQPASKPVLRPRPKTEPAPSQLDSPPVRPRPKLVIVPPPEIEAPKAKPAPVEEPKPVVLTMPAEAVQAIYIAYHTLGNPQDRDRILEFIQASYLNAVVIDIKNDWGYLGYASQVSQAARVEASRPLVKDLEQTLAMFKANQVRTIARFVTFKDNLLARAEPAWAARHPHTGDIWWDGQGLAWLDPLRPEVWDYQLQLAEELEVILAEADTAVAGWVMVVEAVEVQPLASVTVTI